MSEDRLPRSDRGHRKVMSILLLAIIGVSVILIAGVFWRFGVPGVALLTNCARRQGILDVGCRETDHQLRGACDLPRVPPRRIGLVCAVGSWRHPLARRSRQQPGRRLARWQDMEGSGSSGSHVVLSGERGPVGRRARRRRPD